MASTERRVNITHLARKVNINGFPRIAKSYLGSHPFQDRSKEQLEALNNLKPEFYAVTAVVIDRVIGRVLSKREDYPPFGLKMPEVTDLSNTQNISPVEQIADYENLRNMMQDNIDIAIKETIQSFENPDSLDNTGISAYNRLKKLIAVRNKYIYLGLLPPVLDDVEKFISINLGGVSLMTALIEILPKIYVENGLKLNPTDMALTLKNSFPIVSNVAMRQLDDADAIIMALSRSRKHKASPLNLKYFSLKDSGNGKKMFFNKSLEKTYKIELDEIKKFPDPYIGSLIVGCPAMVNFGDGSAVQKLWTWCTELAQVIYQHKYKGQVSS